MNDSSTATKLVKSGEGTLVLGSTSSTLFQANTYSGGTYINQGTVTLTSPGSDLDGLLGAAGSLVALNGGVLRIQSGNFNGTSSAAARELQIGESGGVLDIESGRTVNWTGKIAGFAGAPSATQGVLTRRSTGGTLNVSSDGNNLAGGFFHQDGNTNFTGNNNIFGYIEQDAGTLTISGSGNQIGRLRLDGGSMFLSGTTITSATPGEIIQMNGGSSGVALWFLNNNVINRELRINVGEVNFGDSGNTASFNTYNPANMVVGTSGQVRINSANGILGRTIQNLTLGGGSLVFNISDTDINFTLKGLSGNNNSIISNDGAANVNLVIESDLNLTFDGQLNDTFGTLRLIKNGTGMLTLTNGASKYHGGITVNAGVLNVTNLSSTAGGLGDGGTAASQLILKNGTALRFSGANAGLFNRSLTIEAGAEGVSFVAAGTGSTTAQTLAATFRVNFSNNQSIVYSGVGNAHIILTGSNAGNNTFGLLIGDNGASATSLTKTGTGTWVMTRANNTYSGTTTILGGTLAITANNALGAAGGPAVRLAGGTLELRNVNYTAVETLAMEGGTLAALTGTNRWAGDVYLGVNSTINVAIGSSLAIGKLSGRGGLTFTGEGTLIFEGANYPTAGVPNGYGYGSVAVQAGTLVLRYTNATENKLPGNNSLTLGGGRLGATLHIENDSGGSFTQLFEDDVSGTNLNAGAHRITRDANASNIWLKLNGLNRAVGATLELGGDNIITVDLLNINGILGGWATVVMPDGSLSWAFNSGVQASTSGGGTMGNPSIINGFGTVDSYVRGLSSSLYAVDLWGAETSGALAGFLRNTDVVTSGLTQTNENTNTLRFNQNASTVLNLVGTNTVMSGGILVTPLVGGTGGAKYSKIQGGTITAGANSLGTDLLINQASVNGVFEIASVIANNPGNDPSVATPPGLGNGAFNSTKIGTRQLTLSAADIAKVFPGMQVSGPGITEGTYILAIDKATNTVTLSLTHTATGGTTVTLQYNQKNGSIAANTAVMNLSGGQQTTNLYVGMIVTGANIPAGTTILQINSSTQITLSTNIVPGSSGPFNFSASNGLIKNGDGMLLLTGLNTYTGVTVINEGSLAVLSLADGGVASSLGASSTAAGNLVFNGGTLMFAGETGLSNRGFTNNNEALLDVMREAATMSLTGSYVTPNSISEYALKKTGSGTLILGGASGGGYGLTRLVAEDGTLRLLLTSNDRFARSDVSYLEVSGGTFEIFGSTGSFSQNMPKKLVVGAGASVIKVTSEGAGTIMSLNLGDGTDSVDRRSGGTVLFQENPTLNGVANVNGGVANIRLSLPGIYSNIIIPWAVYQDTSNFSQIGVNEFASSTPNLSANGIGEIVSASSLFLHDIGLNSGTGGTANAANWNGTIRNPSESDVPSTNFAGTTEGNASVDTLRFFSATANSVVTVGSTFRLNNGAILLANHIGNRDKSIVGGTLTSGLVSGTNVVDLIIHNYNPANDFVIGSQIVDNVTAIDNSDAALALVHTGTGTTTLTGSNTYTGKTYITGGVLKLDQAAALPTNSNLVLDGGVLGLNYATAFTRTLGTGVGQVQFTGNGGFAAYGADRTVSLNSNATLTWGLGGFVGGSNMLLFGANDATHTVLFTNSIDLGRFVRVVKVANGAAAVEAEMSGALGGPGGAIIKTGTGALKLTGANTYTGSTVVADGTLIVNSGTNLGATGVEMSTTVESSTDTTAILQFDGTAAPVDTMALPITVGNKNTDSINVVKTQEDFNLTGAVTINRTSAMGSTFLAPKAGTTATYSSITGTGGITIVDSGTGAGEGTVVLSGSNSYGTGGYSGPGAGITGGTVVREGKVLLRHSNALGSTTVELGDVNVPKSDVKWATDGRSVLSIGGNYDTDSDGIGLSGGAGAFLNVNQSLLGGTVAVNDRVLVKDEMGNPELNGIYRISQINPDGTVNLVRATDFDGAGEMQYGSTVTVNNPSSSQNGTTWFMASPNVTTPNAPDTDPSIWLATAINANVGLQADLAGITVANNIDVNATNGTGSTVLGGSTGLTSGSATFSGAVTLQNVANGQAENKTVELTSSTGTVTVADDIKFTGIIGEAALEDMLSLNKTGTGRVTLSGANTYRGTTTVSQGTLRAASNNALGGTGSAGTTVADGATLELFGFITIPSSEALGISGFGVNGGGALRNVVGNNAYNGVITLNADASINSAAGTLTLGATPNSVIGTNRNLSIVAGASASVVVTGAISLGTGSVSVGGTGTVTYQAANSYSGGTTVNGSTLLVNNASGAGTGSGSITVKAFAGLGGNGFIAPSAGSNITIESGGTLAVGAVGGPVAENLNIALASGSNLDISGVLRLDMYANEAGITDTEVDRLIITEAAPGNKGTVSLGATATLQIGNMGGLTDALLTAGSSWKLIDWGGLAVTGTFSNLTNNTMLADLPTLTGGKYWDFSQLYTQGTVSIAIVPEPGRVVLLLVGVSALVLRRRRKLHA